MIQKMDIRSVYTYRDSLKLNECIICMTHLVPERMVWLLANLLAVLLIHAPKAETIHNLSKSVIIIEKLNRSHHVEDYSRLLTHEQGVDRTGDFDDVVARLAAPFVPVERRIMVRHQNLIRMRS